MGDWIGHGATPNNWRSLGTDVDSGQKSSVTSGIQLCTGPWLQQAPGKGGMDLGKCFFEGGKKPHNKHHLLNLTSSF